MVDMIGSIEEKIGEIIVGNTPARAAEVIRKIMLRLVENTPQLDPFVEVDCVIDTVCEREFG